VGPASAVPAEKQRGGVALWRGSAAVPGRGLCSSLVFVVVLGRREPSRVGSENVEALELRTDDSGWCGTLDWVVARSKLKGTYRMSFLTGCWSGR
jgi:hypothetical protein